MANIKIRNLNPGSNAQITSGSFLATALNEFEGTNETSTVRATASQIVSGGAVYANFSEELMISGVPVSTGSTVGGKEVLKPGPGGSIEFGDTNTTVNVEGPSIFKESVTINKTLDVTEAATFNSTSLFKGNSTFESNTTFGTDATDTSIFNSTSVFNENSSFQKDVSIGGNLTVGGKTALALGYDGSHNGKVLKVVQGALSWETDNAGLSSVNWGQITDAPAVSSSNNGKVLKIVNGSLAWATDDSGLSSINWSQVDNKPATFTPSTHTHSWSNITSGKPTTLAGYGITDAQPLTSMGNYVTVSAYNTKFGNSNSWSTIAHGSFLSKSTSGAGSMAVQAKDGSSQGSTFGLISDTHDTVDSDKFLAVYYRDYSKKFGGPGAAKSKRMGINMGMVDGSFGLGWIGSVEDPETMEDNANIFTSTRNITSGAVSTVFEGHLGAGSVSASVKTFKIKHPIKPDTHWLYHCAIEAPEANTLYRGTATLVSGSAKINIDSASNMTEGTFIALNTNTQCFTNNESNWDLIRGSINGNILTIESQNSDSTAEVSWMVIGERHDDFMKNDNENADSNGKIIPEIEITEEEETSNTIWPKTEIDQ